jgi:hypothetical protein
MAGRKGVILNPFVRPKYSSCSIPRGNWTQKWPNITFGEPKIGTQPPIPPPPSSQRMISLTLFALGFSWKYMCLTISKDELS